MTDSEYIKTRKATADALINWAKLALDSSPCVKL